MNNITGEVTLEQLLALNLDEVQYYLNTLQHLDNSSLESVERFYRETQGILLLIVLVDEFLVNSFLQNNIEARAHLRRLRFILYTNHQSRLQLLASL
jgi:hypothetical protein